MDLGFASLGAIGVNSFFILSGFLITSSWINHPDFIQFIWRRILRIFPAFWMCLVVTSFLLAPIALFFNKQLLPTPDILANQLTYLFYNATLIINQYDISNLTLNLTQISLNGSLWTLSWEFLCYFFVSVVGILGLLNRRKIWIITAIAIYIVTYWYSECRCTMLLAFHVSESVALLPYMFGVGMLSFLYKNYIPNSTWLMLISIIGWIIDLLYNIYFPLHPFFLAYMLLWLVVNFPVKSFEKHGDYSYGIYIYHFPIFQLLLLSTDKITTPSWLFLMALPLILLMAYLSWKYIEKPALSFNKIFEPKNNE
jgi:peptidoglycan/LPS O-acetylase OafA/YrhL